MLNFLVMILLLLRHKSLIIELLQGGHRLTAIVGLRIGSVIQLIMIRTSWCIMRLLVMEMVIRMILIRIGELLLSF